MKFTQIMLLVTALSSSAHALAYTGNDLIQWLPEYEANKGSWAGGMFLGYVGGVSEVGQGVLYCAPATATHGQSAAITAKYLRNNPEKWNLSASSLIVSALQAAYPACKP
jgi:hypothetical protein